MHQRWLPCVALLVLTACARTVTPARTLANTRPAVPEALATVAAAPTEAFAPQKTTKEPSPTFELVKQFDSECAVLHPLPEKTFVSCNQELYVIEGDEIRSEPMYTKGIEPETPVFNFGIASIAGNWPNAAWLGTNRTTASSAYGEFYHWTGEQWHKEGNSMKLGLALWDIAQWSEERAVAIMQPTLGFGARLIALGNKPFAVPRFTQPALTHEHCPTRMQVQITATLSPGDVMVAGWACDVSLERGVRTTVYSGLGIERLRATSSVGEFSVLRGLSEHALSSSCRATALVPLSPSEVLLAAHCRINRDDTVGYFARLIGTSFVEEHLPIDGIVKLVWRESNDVFWATDLENRLWRGQAGNWARVQWEVPDGEASEITQGWARGPNDVWLVTQNNAARTSAVYRARPH